MFLQAGKEPKWSIFQPEACIDDLKAVVVEFRNIFHTKTCNEPARFIGFLSCSDMVCKKLTIKYIVLFYNVFLNIMEHVH